MEPATAALIMAGAGAGLGFIGGERQKAAQERAQEQFLKDQAERDRINLIAQAYGLGGVSGAQMMQPATDPTMTAMQGGLAGAQFAVMNPSLWGSGGKTPTPPPTDLAMNTTAPQVMPQQQIMNNPMQGIDPLANYGNMYA